MGICHRNRTLNDAVNEKDRLFAETGRIYGMSTLDLIDDDPATFMRFQMRILAACIDTREMAKLIAASPTSLLMGELLFMLATPEGDVVCASHGLIGHMQSVPFIVRALARLDFESNPGIKPGDIFSTNDPYYGAPHGSDCFTLLPVFYEKELIAWVVGMNHILDVGGIVAGGLSGLSPNAFTDGFLYPPTKTGENYRQHKWWELFWQRRTRLGAINILDDKMRVAGGVFLHNKTLRIVDEFGIDYFRRGVKEILERERRQLTDRIRMQAVPGVYRILMFDPVRYKGIVGEMFPSSNRDWLIHLPEEFQILPNGSLLLDFEGLSSEADFHCNIYEPGIRMDDSLGASPMFAYTSALNTALMYVLEYRIPPGSMGNPRNPFAGTAMGLGVAGKYPAGFWNCLSNAFFARGFLEECFPQDPGGVGLAFDGVMADGTRWAGGNIGFLTCQSSAACPYKDGSPANWAPPNPQSDLGEVEQVEFTAPTQLDLALGLVPNYFGHGRFRGGLGMNIVQLVCDPGQTLVISAFSFGSSETGPIAHGRSGGYPGLGTVTYFFHDTNIREMLKQGSAYPTTFVQARDWLREGKLKARRVRLYPGDTPNIPCKDGDLFITAANAKGGWGDPLERDLALVENDLLEGWITPDVARQVYGVATNKDGQADATESRDLRVQVRKARENRSTDARDWWEEERQQVLEKRFSEDVRNMYADCLKYQKFRRDFMGMWQVTNDYEL